MTDYIPEDCGFGDAAAPDMGLPPVDVPPPAPELDLAPPPDLPPVPDVEPPADLPPLPEPSSLPPSTGDDAFGDVVEVPAVPEIEIEPEPLVADAGLVPPDASSDWVVPTGDSACGQVEPAAPVVDPLTTLMPAATDVQAAPVAPTDDGGMVVSIPNGFDSGVIGPVTTDTGIAPGLPQTDTATLLANYGIDPNAPQWQNVSPGDPMLDILRTLEMGPAHSPSASFVDPSQGPQMMGEIWGRMSAATSNLIGPEGYTATYDSSTGTTGWVFEGDLTPSTPISSQLENNPRSPLYDPEY
jgi:hypothetical protein